MNISMEIKVGLPNELPVDSFELSIVFANALENAIHAVKELPEDQRRIICRSVTYPRFIMEIRLAFDVDHGAVMQDTVQDSGGNGDVGKDLIPLGEGLVGSEDGGGLLIASGNQLEEQIVPIRSCVFLKPSE